MATLGHNQWWQYHQSSRCHVSISRLLHRLDIHPNQHMGSLTAIPHPLKLKVTLLQVILNLLLPILLTASDLDCDACVSAIVKSHLQCLYLPFDAAFSQIYFCMRTFFNFLIFVCLFGFINGIELCFRGKIISLHLPYLVHSTKPECCIYIGSNLAILSSHPIRTISHLKVYQHGILFSWRRNWICTFIVHKLSISQTIKIYCDLNSRYHYIYSHLVYYLALISIS